MIHENIALNQTWTAWRSYFDYNIIYNIFDVLLCFLRFDIGNFDALACSETMKGTSSSHNTHIDTLNPNIKKIDVAKENSWKLYALRIVVPAY